MPATHFSNPSDPHRWLLRNRYQEGPGFRFLATQNGRPPEKPGPWIFGKATPEERKVVDDSHGVAGLVGVDSNHKLELTWDHGHRQHLLEVTPGRAPAWGDTLGALL